MIVADNDIPTTVDNMIDLAIQHRAALRMEWDSIIIAEVHPDLHEKLERWGALDYLEIAHHIHVKIRES